MGGTNQRMCEWCGEDYDKVEGVIAPNICEECEEEYQKNKEIDRQVDLERE